MSPDWYLIRAIGLICFLAAGLFYFIPVAKDRPKWILLLLFAFAVTRLAPIEISFRVRVGGPQFVPLVQGFPTQTDVALAQNGDAILYGCMVSGYEPKWILVW